MTPLSFFALRPTETPSRWELDVVPSLCSRHGGMFGGCSMGAAIEVLEQVTGRPLVWASAQFLSLARPPAVFVIDVEEVSRGRQISQARARATVDGKEILTVTAALGSRPGFDLRGSWAERPAVPPPDACRPRQLLESFRGTLIERLDMRVANGRDPDELPGPPGTGRSAMWVRLPDVGVSPATLAVIGDFVAYGMSQATGQRAGGNSLDNTLRVAHRSPTEWVLADVQVHALTDGFAHGLLHLWAEDGALLGTASQSVIARYWDE